MTESCSDRSPLPALLVGGMVVLLVQTVLFLADWIGSPTSTSYRADAPCAYEVFQDNVCLGTVFCDQPQNISSILHKLGRSDLEKRAGLERCVPCGSSIRLEHNSLDMRVTAIPGARMMAAGKKIDINRAQETDLLCIPGIGPTLAARIVQERTERNGFKSLEDMRSIRGIGQKKWKSLAQWLEVDRSPDTMPARASIRTNQNESGPHPAPRSH